ncbi:fatty-acid amide hydrolase 1-like [Liolophura sinensis]|uniref:fatty-acid amide hydrolase 1-like n=1 Tax=Liolophura sinensis TaxID=3198878 RepID=UPI00315845D4
MRPYIVSSECPSMTLSLKRLANAAAVLSVTLATTYGVYVIIRQRNRLIKVNKKRKDCSASKKRLQLHLEDIERSEGIDENITELDFTDLQQRLQDGALDAVTVLRAYQQKALRVDRELNCIIEPIAEAEDWARNSNQGPLHGIPISLKDYTPIKGYDFTLGGCANLLGMAHPMDASFIQVLKKQGAVPFVITNAPQMHLSFACVNPLFGYTGNPHNPARTPGGSSGGEGALIGGHGSILGIGTDMGGSVRVPAAFCGTCALKPTHERFSYLGYFPIMQTIVAPTTGPMARDVTSLVAFMRAVLVPDLWTIDPTTPPMPFREEIYTTHKPLRIGYYKDDGYVPCIPAYHRAIDLVREVLEKQGHTLVPFQVPDVKYAIEDVGLRAILGDGAEFMKLILTGDEVSRDLLFPVWKLWMPKWLRRIACFFESFSDKRRSKVLQATCAYNSVSDWCTLTGQARTYRLRVIKEWKEENLDAVICPPCACVAMPDGLATRLGVIYSYTFLYNVLNFPAGVVPVTTVNREDITRLQEYPADCDGQRVMKRAMQGSEGMPVGVQCVGLPFQEELVLRVMKAVEDGLKVQR